MTFEYLAGLVDGEGCIRLSPSNKGPYRRFYPRLQVTNTHYGIMIRLQDQFGGSIVGPKCARDSKKPCWDWQISGDRCREILRSILPFLIIKAEKATEVLAGDQKTTK